MSQIQKLAGDLELDGYVDFLGARNDIPDLMRAADIYVLSSAWEGLPLVIGEAMASEKLVVATDCGGVSEFLGDAGILAAPRDPAALADGLREALNMPANEASILGSRARMRIVANYSLDSVADRWVELYRCLSSRVS
jgi:glycosyltransferase involved in cell wall biosynthesis